MKKSLSKNRGIINSQSLMGFLIFLLFMIINPGCTKDSTTMTNSPATTNPPKNKTTAFYIGESYGGGIIFYIDETGQHGLISATSDLGDATGRMRWGSAAYYTSGAVGTAIGTGSLNTTKIIAVEGQTLVYAARLCRNYHGGGYYDWFLPSKDEIYQLYLHKAVVGGFVYGAYWSSSEFDHSLAWGKYFYNNQAQYSHKDRFNGVRAIRAF